MMVTVVGELLIATVVGDELLVATVYVVGEASVVNNCGLHYGK